MYNCTSKFHTTGDLVHAHHLKNHYLYRRNIDAELFRLFFTFCFEIRFIFEYTKEIKSNKKRERKLANVCIANGVFVQTVKNR